MAVISHAESHSFLGASMKPLSADDPHTVGEFQLRARLGAGGMGRVYLGFSPAGRPVAVKLVHPELARVPEFIQRFAREVAAARAVSGIYTAQVVGSGLRDEAPWLATTYVPGSSLQGLVAGYGPLPEDALWRLGAGLAEALQAIHGCGLIHRDLKPANVLMAVDGPHVIDFGISRALDATGSLTATGIVLGTPGYMSPEQARGEPVTPASDVFSLACVLVFAATGTQPFGDGTPAAVLYRIVSAEPDLGGVPPGQRDLLAACLAKDPAQRPPLSSLAAAFARGGPGVPDSLSSFWPESVADAIRRSIPDIQDISNSAGTGTELAYAAPAPSYAPAPPYGPASSHGPASRYAPDPWYGSATAGSHAPVPAPVYGGPSYGELPPPGYVPGVTSLAPADGARPAATMTATAAGDAARDAAGDASDARVAAAMMLAGAVVTVANLILCFQARASLLLVAQLHPFMLAGRDARTMAGQIAVYALLPYVLGLLGWLATAAAAIRGRPRTPVLATVLFSLGTITTALILLHVHAGRKIDVLCVAIWLLGLLSLIVLRTRGSRAFFGRG